MAALWRSGALRGKELRDADGRRLVLLHQGLAGSGGGPDFRNAAVLWPEGAPGGGETETRLGDIELHTDSRLWRQHGHQRDPAFNGVILHVVAGHRAGTVTRLEDGRTAPVLQIEEHLNARLRLPILTVPCLRAAYKYPETTLRSLRRAGVERFRNKAQLLSVEIASRGPDQALYSGIMDGLGYMRNRKPFRELAARIPLTRLESCGSAEEKEAMLMGSAGLLPRQRPGAAMCADSWSVQLEALCPAQNGGDHMNLSDWDFCVLRPANSPPRRLAAMARISGLWPLTMSAGFGRLIENCALAPARLPGTALIAPAEGYWAQHWDFGRMLNARGRNAALLGADRAGEIAVNVLLPFAMALSGLDGNARLKHAAACLYAVHPAAAGNRVTRFMAEQLWPGRKPALDACKQQGLIHVYQEFCRLGRCEKCPLRD